MADVAILSDVLRLSTILFKIFSVVSNKVATYLFSVRFTFVNIRQVKGPLVGHMPDKTHSPGNFRLSILFSLFCGVSDFGPSVITLSGVPLILPIRNVSAVISSMSGGIHSGIFEH